MMLSLDQIPLTFGIATTGNVQDQKIGQHIGNARIGGFANETRGVFTGGYAVLQEERIKTICL